MPTLAQMNIPTPKSWDEFEEITLDALKSRWDSKDLSRHGRQGQTQNGVDIYGVDNLYQSIGVQCKKYDTNLTIATIKDEIAKAENFEPILTRLYFATTAPRDAKLQREIRLICKGRVENNKFAVGIFFWDDIIQDLISNQEVFSKHYPQLVKVNKQIPRSNLIGLLDLVFFGTSFKFYMKLIFGEFGIEPLEMQAICELIDSGTSFIKNDKSRNNLCIYINNFSDCVFNQILKGKSLQNGWKIANDLATSIEFIIASVASGLEGEELLVYKIGETLSIWERKVNQNKNILIGQQSIKTFFRLIDKLDLRIEYIVKIKDLIETELNNLEEISNVQIPYIIYNSIRNGLIEKGIF
ncbi:hypothetical protein LL037_23860 [Clostridium estertheticum]|uniref:hypothetical protein n=1 Tax=Clostridium estertheticum TaxID=238834 RepID=UPI001C0DE4FD|nr:hypothetical protein [Clostridium estertheticum]MBU3199490.1 hypothetical protein [Clostridium estertheticum]WAG65432.1 hypothetical protein LL037_23860 [Clostridium estertheticum]